MVRHGGHPSLEMNKIRRHARISLLFKLSRPGTNHEIRTGKSGQMEEAGQPRPGAGRGAELEADS